MKTTPPQLTATALPYECRALVEMLETLPDDLFIRWPVIGQCGEIIKAARDAYESKQLATAKVYQFRKRTKA